MTTVGELLVASPVAPWQAIGLRVEAGLARIGGITVRFVPAQAGNAVVGWGLVGAPDDTVTEIDGLATHHLAEVPAGGGTDHPLGVLGFDHQVVLTSSLERTCGAIEAATGAPLKRIREAGAVRQGFHRLGELIVEVVESPQVSSNAASFWGFVWNVADLGAVCDRLGPAVISAPKPAVQPGRSIATFRSGLGLGLPAALMSPPSRS
ncbi:MAG: hypothetical protein Q7V57_18325 [Actinomycetota bacterium]|nr:hypothetical protein [Actinomycetota bacterium]